MVARSGRFDAGECRSGGDSCQSSRTHRSRGPLSAARSALPTAASVDAQFDVDADGVRVGQLHATAGSSALTASGRYSWRGLFDAKIDINQEDLSDIAEQFRIGARVSGSARLAGTLSGKLIEGHAHRAGVVDVVGQRHRSRGSRSRGRDRARDCGAGRRRVRRPSRRRHRASGRALQLEIVNRTGYPVSGQITLDHDRHRRADPGPAIARQIGDLSGRLSATARGSGLLSDPAAIRGRIDLRALDIMARGTRLALAAPGSSP